MPLLRSMNSSRPMTRASPVTSWNTAGAASVAPNSPRNALTYSASLRPAGSRRSAGNGRGVGKGPRAGVLGKPAAVALDLAPGAGSGNGSWARSGGTAALSRDWPGAYSKPGSMPLGTRTVRGPLGLFWPMTRSSHSISGTGPTARPMRCRSRSLTMNFLHLQPQPFCGLWVDHQGSSRGRTVPSHAR
ncbi:hypothetical protein D3C84_266740 [compost metagenome]